MVDHSQPRQFDGWTVPVSPAGLMNWLMVFGCFLAALALPAILNGYPYLFPDVAGYILPLYTNEYSPFRPTAYTQLMALVGWLGSGWAVFAVQLVIVAAILSVAVAMLVARPSAPVALAVTLTVGLGTAAGFNTGFLLPDAFTVPMVILLCLASLRGEKLRLVQVIALALTLGFLARMHATHVLLLGGAGALIIGMQLLWKQFNCARTTLTLLAVALISAVVPMLVAGKHYGDSWSISPGGQTFLFARLYEDGPARRTMLEACPSLDNPICERLEPVPRTVIETLWRPGGLVDLEAHYSFREINQAAGALVRKTIQMDTTSVVRAMVRNSGAQFVSFASFDTGYPQDWRPEEGVYGLVGAFWPRDQHQFAKSHMMAQTGAFSEISMLHQAITWLGLLALGPLACLAWQAGHRDLVLLAVVSAAVIVANAILCGALSGVFDRYQARVAWLAVLVSVLISIRLWPKVQLSGASDS